MDAPHHDKERKLTRERRRYASHAETKQDYSAWRKTARSNSGGLNAETRGGIEPMGKIFLLTFLFIGLPDIVAMRKSDDAVECSSTPLC
jgi:hypothetical protein